MPLPRQPDLQPARTVKAPGGAVPGRLDSVEVGREINQPMTLAGGAVTGA